MYSGRILALAFLIFCAGCALTANCWRSLEQGEGMYDAESTATMRISGWFGVVLGLGLAAVGGLVVVGAVMRWFG